MPEHTDVIVIGAGQAGLAMSHCLTASGIDHLVLDRGAIAERWRNERWASLRLLTPNWMTRLPGHRYAGPDPDGFMHKDAVADHLARYADGAGPGWRPELAARRIVRWIGYTIPLVQGQPQERSDLLFRALGMHARYLGWRWRRTRPSGRRPSSA